MPSFPALDPEPGPPTSRRTLVRTAVVVGAVAVVAGGTAGGWIAATSGGRQAGGLPPGHLLAWSRAAGGLALVRPDGSGAQPYTALGPVSGDGGVVSPDATMLVTWAGDLVTLRNGVPVKRSTSLYGPLSASATSTSSGSTTLNFGAQIDSLTPFADGTADVAFTSAYDPQTQVGHVELASTTDAAVHDLGQGGGYSGDPQQAGVFVAVPSTSFQIMRDGAPAVDDRIEHRVVGGATSTVVTSDAVANALGFSSGSDFAMAPTADPTGASLAVEVDDPMSGQQLGLLVFTRAGALVATAPEGADSPVSWSPSGDRLLYVAGGDAVIWAPGAATRRIALPAGVRSLQSCAWSPDERDIACIGYPSAANGPVAPRGWVLIDRGSATATTYPPGPVPLLWVGR